MCDLIECDEQMNTANDHDETNFSEINDSEDLNDGHTIFFDGGEQPVVIPSTHTFAEFRKVLQCESNATLWYGINTWKNGSPLNYEDEWVKYVAAVRCLTSQEDMHVWRDEVWSDPE